MYLQQSKNSDEICVRVVDESMMMYGTHIKTKEKNVHQRVTGPKQILDQECIEEGL